MNRRTFLRVLGAGVGGAAVAAVDPDLLRWVPGARTYFDIQRPSGLWVSEALNRGDLFTIEGVYAMNPVTMRQTPHLQYFTVTTDVVGQSALPRDVVYPSLRTRGAYANVSVDPYTAPGRRAVRPILIGAVTVPIHATHVDG